MSSLGGITCSPGVMEKKIFKISLMYFAIFVISYPCKRARPFIWIYFTQWCFVLSLVKLATWFWRRREVSSKYVDSSYYIPVGKGVVLHLNKLESPSPKDASYQVEIGSVVLEKKKMWTFTTTTTMDNGQIVILKKSSLELSAQVSFKALGNAWSSTRSMF